MTCCPTCYSDCEPLLDCPTSFLVYTPNDFEDSEIIVRITNAQGVAVAKRLTVQETGYVEIPLDEYPEGYFNPWSGVYKLEFMTIANSGKPIEFTPLDGLLYNCINFQFVSNQGDSPDIYINIFNDSAPGGYGFD